MNTVHIELRVKESEDVLALLKRLAAWIEGAPKDRKLRNLTVYAGEAPIDR